MTSASVAGGLPMGSRLDPALRRLGPALRKRQLPLAALGVSAMGHALLLLAFLGAILWGGWQTSRTYVVNLVPAVAAVGSPNAPAGPSLPARPTAPPASRATQPEPEPREAPAREAARLPEPSLPSARPLPRSAAVRPGEKELPPLGGPATAKTGERVAESRPAPAAALGQPAGSAAGVGALSLDVSDFPYAWYLRQVVQKVETQWQRQNPLTEPGQKPLVFVEIQRDGSIRAPTIEKSSGNALYDQAALRAIVEASPFPPLPQDWAKPSLRVMFRFELERGRG